MIELIQYKINSSTLNSPYDKMEEIEISMNKELITKDLDRLKKDYESPKNKYDKANLKALISYLEKLLKNINEDSIYEMCWNTKDELPYTYPLQLISEKAYRINLCNYIEVSENEKVIELDLTELADIIAFEFMYRDLGETHDSIEELLKDCGIVAYEPASILTKFFKDNGDHMFELSKTMKIDDTPYFSFETKKIKDYFNSKEFRTDKYREVIDYSCRYANTIITNTIIKNSIHNNISSKIVSIDATSITIITNVSNEVNIKQKLLEDIAVRAFGRRFIIEPKISIF